MFLSMLLAATLLFSTIQPAHAATQTPPPPPERTSQAEKEGPQKDPKASVTRHSITVSGKKLAYTATAGEIPLNNDAGETEARIFYTAYTLDNPASGKKRPLLFMFNGGPGAASVWLHLGAIGPRRVEMLPDGSMPAPPYRLVDNASTWLDQGDLVFVDPVGTGFSRAAKPDLAKTYASVHGDIDSLGKFIRLYLSKNERWGSPIFLVGESYGTFRVAGLSEHLLEHGIAANGVILISTVLNLQTLSFDVGNDLPYELFLPSYAATAWYHKKLAPDLQQDLDRTLAEVENWASTDYLLALDKGDRLSPAERRAVAEKLSRYTGLDRKFIEDRNLRINSRIFIRELLRDRQQVTGVMDSRLVAANVDPSAYGGFDPTVTSIRPPFTTEYNAYVREELKYQSDLEYFTLGGGIPAWDWEAKNEYAYTSDNLRNSMAKNPYMKVLVASGLFDLATPHYGAEYTMDHLGLTEKLRRNITKKRYRSGHMMYLEQGALAQLKEDAKEFIQSAMQEGAVTNR